MIDMKKGGIIALVATSVLGVTVYQTVFNTPKAQFLSKINKTYTAKNIGQSFKFNVENIKYPNSDTDPIAQQIKDFEIHGEAYKKDNDYLATIKSDSFDGQIPEINFIYKDEKAYLSSEIISTYINYIGTVFLPEEQMNSIKSELIGKYLDIDAFLKETLSEEEYKKQKDTIKNSINDSEVMQKAIQKYFTNLKDEKFKKENGRNILILNKSDIKEYVLTVLKALEATEEDKELKAVYTEQIKEFETNYDTYAKDIKSLDITFSIGKEVGDNDITINGKFSGDVEVSLKIDTEKVAMKSIEAPKNLVNISKVKEIMDSVQTNAFTPTYSPEEEYKSLEQMLTEDADGLTEEDKKILEDYRATLKEQQ